MLERMGRRNAHEAALPLARVVQAASCCRHDTVQLFNIKDAVRALVVGADLKSLDLTMTGRDSRSFRFDLNKRKPVPTMFVKDRAAAIHRLVGLEFAASPARQRGLSTSRQVQQSRARSVEQRPVTRPPANGQLAIRDAQVAQKLLDPD